MRVKQRWMNLVPWAALAAAAGCSHFPRMTELPQEPAQAHMGTARMYESLGQASQARDEYKAALTEYTQSADAHHRLGQMAARHQAWNEAEQHFRTALLTRPDDANILSDYGYMLYQQNRLNEAEAQMRAALKQEPENKRILNNLGLIVGMQGDFATSRELFRRAGTEAQALANIAYIYAQNHEFQRAQRAYAQSLSLDGGNRAAGVAYVQLCEARATSIPKLEQANAAPRGEKPGTPQVSKSQPAPESSVAAPVMPHMKALVHAPGSPSDRASVGSMTIQAAKKQHSLTVAAVDTPIKIPLATPAPLVTSTSTPPRDADKQSPLPSANAKDSAALPSAYLTQSQTHRTSTSPLPSSQEEVVNRSAPAPTKQPDIRSQQVAHSQREENSSPAVTKTPAPVVVTAKVPMPVVADTKVPVAATAKVPAPVVAPAKAPVPVAATAKAPAPVVADTKAPTPIVATAKIPVPVAATTKAPAPVVADTKAPAPVAATTKKPTPQATTPRKPVPHIATTRKPIPHATSTARKPAPLAAATPRKPAPLDFSAFPIDPAGAPEVPPDLDLPASKKKPNPPVRSASTNHSPPLIASNASRQRQIPLPITTPAAPLPEHVPPAVLSELKREPQTFASNTSAQYVHASSHRSALPVHPEKATPPREAVDREAQAPNPLPPPLPSSVFSQDIIFRQTPEADMAPVTDEDIAQLVTLLHNGSTAEREAAATALGEFGEKAANAIPALIEALVDKKQAVRAAANAALKKIGNEDAADSNTDTIPRLE